MNITEINKFFQLKTGDKTMSTENKLQLDLILNSIDKFNGFMDLLVENTRLKQLCDKQKQDLDEIHKEINDNIVQMNNERCANNLVNMANQQLIAELQLQLLQLKQ